MKRNGFRTNGDRKTRLINQANAEILALGSKGVNIQLLMKILGIKGDAFTMSTKEWSGVIGMIKQFRKDNNV